MSTIRRVLRQLTRTPGFSTTVALTLAVGIGASTLIFSVIDGVLLEPLPYPDSSRLVAVSQLNERGARVRISDPNFADLEVQTSSLASFAQYAAYEAAIAGGDEPVLTIRADVSNEFFDAFEVQPLLGRTFAPDEQRFGAAPTAVVSYAFWQRYLGGSTDLGARTLRIAGSVFSVVGVMPRGFDYPDGADVWTPRELWPQLGRSAHNFWAVGRLAPDVSLDTARREFSDVARRLKVEYGDDTSMVDASVVALQDNLVGNVRPALLVLAAAAALLFVIAVANTLNMMLARVIARERDYAVRLALGARRLTLARDLFVEALLLCALGGALGVLAASWGAEVLVALQNGLLPRADAIRVDVSTMTVAIALVLIVAAVLSLLVAWRIPAGALELRGARHATAGKDRARLRDGLVAAQIAIALVLSVGAALLARSYLAVVSVDPGFRSDGLLLVNVVSPYSREQQPQIRAFNDRVLEELQSLPGVAAVGGVNALPLQSSGTNGAYVVLERPDEVRDFEGLSALSRVPGRAGYAEYRVASDGYFDVLDIPLLRGRVFALSDGPDAAHVAVVSRSLADAKWPGEDPLGKLIQFAGMDGDFSPFTVVGVVGDVRDYGLDRDQRPTVYAYYRQRPAFADTLWFAVRLPAVEAAIAAARAAVQRVDPDVPMEFSTSEQLYADSIAQRRFNLVLLAVFGAAALALSLGGIYGAIAFSVAQRSQEFGVRVALGATLPDVVTLVLHRCLWITGIGIVAGFAVAFGAARVAASLLYGVAPHDPLSYAVAGALLLVTAIGAALTPALRAARVDPVAALHND